MLPFLRFLFARPIHYARVVPNAFPLFGNLSYPAVSNVAEDARTSHPCESGAGLLKATQEAGAAKAR